jgi:hypothetical protein
MNANYKINDLPLAELERLGLYKDGKLIMQPDDRNALLGGRRTELISLHELKADGFQIDQLDAKLSIVPDWDGKLILKIHPIYKEAQRHPLLLETEADMLEKNLMSSISKTYNNPPAKSKTYIIEYDPETREFISYDPQQVTSPHKVNGETLSKKQKDDFRNGAVVTLADGTKLQYKATESKGILSDRNALIFSVLLDGGISYLLIRGIRHLLNSNKAQADGQTPAFQKAFAEMEKQQAKNRQATEPQIEENRGYTKTRAR